MNILALCCTSGRHTHLENLVGMFLAQDYEGEPTLLIYNNSSVEQKLDTISLPQGRNIILVNEPINRYSKQPYKTLGEIFLCSLRYIWDNFDKEWLSNALINHLHCDDAYLPHHFSLGVKGYLEGKSKGFNSYKPKRSFFLNGEDLSLVENVLEPSIFVNFMDFVATGGYLIDESVTYDKPWLEGIKLYTTEEEYPSLVYCWGNNAFKISGDPNNPDNFQNARKNDKDEGDGIITPASPNEFYNKIKHKI